MSLESKSLELKMLVAEYSEDWFLGDLWFTIHSGKERSMDQLAKLSSPQRQLYYLAGLTMSTNPETGTDTFFEMEKWNRIVDLLNDIEQEYYKLFIHKDSETEIDEDWIKRRQVAVPSFLSYFNQGHLNYEEQMINWIQKLYTPLNATIQSELGVSTQDFINFYENIDRLVQTNFRAHSTNPELLRDSWDKFTKLNVGVSENVPDFIKEYPKEFMPRSIFMADKGIINRFKPEDIVSEDLSIDKVYTFLKVLSCKRQETDFL